MLHIKERLQKELKEFEHELRHELPKEIQRATALGDLRENAEYHAALERQSYVRARVAQLTERLGQLQSINLSQLPRDRAAFGSLLKLQDLDESKELEYELVLPEDGDPAKGKISVQSPIGRALMGKQPGDEVVVRTPGGERVFEILELSTFHERED
jgi:transcription elongation factor GreA